MNAACAGPRRASITISVMPEPRIASIAASVVSVPRSSSSVSASIRATSTATLPAPTTTTRSPERSNVRSWKSGWPLYQATNSVGGPRAGKILAGNRHPPVGLGADRVDDGVVEAQQVVVAQVAPHLDVAEEAEPGPLGGLLERARDRLDLGVVGRDAEPHEPPRRRQALEEVDLDREVGGEQRPRGVEARRAGADHGDSHRLVVRAHRDSMLRRPLHGGPQCFLGFELRVSDCSRSRSRPRVRRRPRRPLPPGRSGRSRTRSSRSGWRSRSRRPGSSRRSRSRRP